jgi:hypothetical protein
VKPWLTISKLGKKRKGPPKSEGHGLDAKLAREAVGPKRQALTSASVRDALAGSPLLFHAAQRRARASQAPAGGKVRGAGFVAASRSRRPS